MLGHPKGVANCKIKNKGKLYTCKYHFFLEMSINKKSHCKINQNSIMNFATPRRTSSAKISICDHMTLIRRRKGPSQNSNKNK